jgi:hypothetical protein
MRLIISCELPTPLIDELHKAASESRTTPETFAAQTIEAGLAARRLPKIQAAPYGARIPSSWQPSTIEEDVPDAFEGGALSPADVPTLSDLECVVDIT